MMHRALRPLYSAAATCAILVNVPRSRQWATQAFVLNIARTSQGVRPTSLVSHAASAVGTSLQPTLSPTTTTSTALFMSSSSSSTSSETDSLQEVDTMRASEIKKELESYGISTRSFLEKSELVEALKDARSKGLKPKENTASPSSSTSSSTSSSSSSSSSTSSTSSKDTTKDTRPRDERLKEEMEKIKPMKASDIKKELESLGVSTRSYVEKSEFVKALAEARVDGVKNKKSSRRSSPGASTDEEGYAVYKDVEVLTDESAGPRRKQSEQQQQQQQRSSSPFGGGGVPGGMGGMGGMGGIADMLKNMGMGGGGAPGANPFAGGGANPFGGGGGSPFGGGGGGNPFGGGPDMMGKAQQLMQNPKVREILAKAQSNPSMMKKINECMSNPAAFAKYQNDPDVAELVNELRKFM